ncbi:AbrB/MazE/SpoVT family DNA-binding domain-containing protein [Candidatus Woesearchaeota archaeon]|nr:AbrB/MazE/SpoVT family DNA-binding domain-containing protein [Candidatus Woesearchaeota archaeon]
MEVISVSSKGQIVIPEEVRKRHGIRAGSKLVLLENPDTLLLKKEEKVVSQLMNEEGKENAGWLSLAELSLKNVWDNPKDEKVWKKFL